MIRKTVAATQAATFSIELPNPSHAGMPTPSGTGFFISPDGWFVTAGHVVSEKGEPRTDIEAGWLRKEMRIPRAGGPFTPPMGCQWPTLEHFDDRLDIALLKVDLERNKAKEWLKGRSEFPFLMVSTRLLEEGEPVYAFGYPLSEARSFGNDGLTVGITQLSPRVTSAIVASHQEASGPVVTASDPPVYVLDKALNYGNSGGPIVAVETGRAHAVCTRFQPMLVPQPRITNEQPGHVMIPSLYGIVSSLGAPEFVELLRGRGVPLVSD
jgi:serine protease Do